LIHFEEDAVTPVRSSPSFSRRAVIGGLALFPALTIARAAPAATAELTFDELYGKISVLGLEFSKKVLALAGQEVQMGGFMAPPLKAEAQFFVLTEIPMSICPFCSTDSDWPDNIVVIYLAEKQTFVQGGSKIMVSGRLDVGTWIDQDTGFLSRLRIRDANYWTV
jgi:hypothetical protein